MRRPDSLITIAAIALILGFIWTRLSIVIWIPLPWWAALLGLAILFLVVQHWLATMFQRRP